MAPKTYRRNIDAYIHTYIHTFTYAGSDGYGNSESTSFGAQIIHVNTYITHTHSDIWRQKKHMYTQHTHKYIHTHIHTYTHTYIQGRTAMATPTFGAKRSCGNIPQ